MSSHVVIDDHDDLTDIGSLRHAELDKIILEGIIPTLAEGLSPPSLTQERSVGIPLLPSDNAFSGTNTFDTVNVNGDLNVYGTTNQIAVANFNVENTVITVGEGTGGEMPASDRGIVFTAPGPNPSIFWDDSNLEFRFGIVDADSSTTEFPEPDAAGEGGYANIKVGDIVAAALSSGNLNVQNANIQALNADSLVIANSLDATSATANFSGLTSNAANVGQLMTQDGSQDYLSRYIKAGRGVQILPDQNDPGSLIASVARLKESTSPGQFMSVGDIFSSNIVASANDHNNENLDVYVNGVLVAMGNNFDYTLDPTGIRFHFAIEPDDVITVISY